jgi:signal transduction histidine kinase
MKLRTRLLVAFLLAALIPLVALALVVRHEMTARLTAQSQARVDALVKVIEDEVARETGQVHAALAQVKDAASTDNRFRRAAVDGAESERHYLLDYAGKAMRLAGLDMLQIQDASGRIVSSGHFRNDYDRLEPELPRFLNALPDHAALIRARTAGDPLLVLAAADSLVIGGKRFSLVGGVEAGPLHQFTGGHELQVTLLIPGEPSAVPDTTNARAIVDAIAMPYFNAETKQFRMGALRISNDLSEIAALRQSVDRWFLIAVAITTLVVVLLASALASRVSRPVVELAEQTARVDLDKLNVVFDTGRSDEVGTLAKGLAAMTSRLRESTARLKDAERRATMGDLARQVNHDIKNGLTPIRNVFRHISQHADDEPAQLRDVVRERSATIEESINYLENLASNYAKLSQRGGRERCDLNEVVKQVAAGARGAARVETSLAEGAFVDADPVSLRRIVENLVDNAVDSLRDGEGSVTLDTQLIHDGIKPRVRLVVADTGAGMSLAQRAHIFDDFYTTKPDGSGLGLSIVRRLVMDLHGSITVDSVEGQGSQFIVELPVTAQTKVAK